ncbi:MAG TPA: AAA family ATPase, partial [Fimbriimonas sp.]
MSADVRQPMFVIGGVPGSGKTTVCRLLAGRFERSIHIPWDVIREEWVVSGRKLPWDGDPEEMGRQMMLGSRAAFQVARLYSDAGFAVVVDGPLPVHPEILPYALGESNDLDPIRLYIHPRLDVVIERLKARTDRDDT